MDSNNNEQPLADNIGQPLSSGMICFSLLAGHHGKAADPGLMTHKLGLKEGEEADWLLLSHLAKENGFRARKVKGDFDKALAMQPAMPFLGRKKDGGWYIAAGVREDENGAPPRLAVVDPSCQEPEEGMFCFWDKEKWESLAEPDFLLLKPRFDPKDTNRRFDLLWFVPFFYSLKGVFGQIAGAVAALTLLSLILPLFFQIVIDKVLPNETYNTLNVLGVGVCLAILFNGGLEYLRNYLLLYAAQKIDIKTAMATFGHLMRLPAGFFESAPTGLLIKHMQQADNIRGFLSGRLFFTILDLLSLLVFVPFLLVYSVVLTGIVMFFSLLMALVAWLLVRPLQRKLNILYEAEGKRQSKLVEAIKGMHTVKALALEPVQEREWNNASAFAVKSQFEVGQISTVANAISHVLELLMNVGVIWAGAYMVFNQTISIGALIAFQMLSGRVSGPLVQLVALIHEYQQVALSVKMLGSVMNTPQEHPGGSARAPMRGQIEFEHVNFRYRPDLPEVLHDFNLKIKPGEVMGIVGKSGSGKSTLARLIQAINQPQGGVIRLEGIDLREWDKTWLRRGIGVVLQDNYFFQGTIRENISLSHPGAPAEAVINAARIAGADEFVSRMPKGYETQLEESGVNLSGGQRQRLAIARALLGDPAILILDEATSALDPESESIIQENLGLISRNRTVIIITHRLSMVRRADRILVLDSGKVAALGPHHTLAHREGIYQNFWQQQMGKN